MQSMRGHGEEAWLVLLSDDGLSVNHGLILEWIMKSGVVQISSAVNQCDPVAPAISGSDEQHCFLRLECLDGIPRQQLYDGQLVRLWGAAERS